MEARNQGRSLELYFIDGNPDGMLTAEVFNWTGHVLVTPRTEIRRALQRQEAAYTGIYLLLGEKEGEPLAYIGEAEDIASRIRNHDARKDWWTNAVLVTTGANNLNKAHVKYLEARLVEEAEEIGRTPLDNGNAPARPGLSEAAQANMEGFLEYLFIVLPAIGIDMFVRRTRPRNDDDAGDQPPVKGDSPIFETSLKSRGVRATARLENGEFVVQAGSLARKTWVASADHGYAKLFDELVRSGVLVEEGDHRVFAENYAFSSPSAAGAMVKGRSCNGQTTWKVQGTTQSYREWEQQRLTEGAH